MILTLKNIGIMGTHSAMLLNDHDRIRIYRSVVYDWYLDIESIE